MESTMPLITLRNVSKIYRWARTRRWGPFAT